MSDVRALMLDVCGLVNDHLPQLLSMRRSVTWKPDGSPVTDADFLLEAKVKEFLVARLGRLNFVGEESYDSASAIDADWTAVLDPVDGTENFCSGFKEWGLALSLWRGPEHMGSLLMLPEMGDRLMTGDALEYQTSRVVGFSSTVTPTLAAMLAEAGAVGEARIMGCAVYNLFNVVRGALARFVNPAGAKSWDILAGLMLAREHGCDIQVEGENYDGRYLGPDRRHRFDIRHRYDLHPR